MRIIIELTEADINEMAAERFCKMTGRFPVGNEIAVKLRLTPAMQNEDQTLKQFLNEQQ